MRTNFIALRFAALALVLASGGALVSASPAAGQPPTAAPPGNPAVSQYLELVPTVSGAKPTNTVQTRRGGSHAHGLAAGGFGGGPGGGPGGGGPISRSTTSRLDAHGPLGALAAGIAWATAPQTNTSQLRLAGGGSGASPGGTGAAPPSPSSSVLSAVTGSSVGGGLGVLLPILLAGILIGGGGLAFVRRRARARPPSA